MTSANLAGGSRCPPILSREEIARRRREDEQRRLRVVAPEPEKPPTPQFARVRKSRA
jgi:hypothetical protein